MNFDAVLFDVDGTLLDTSEGITGAVGQVIADQGLEPLDRETLLTFIGPPIQDSFQRVYGVDDAEKTRLAAEFRAYYKRDEFLFRAHPYEGIPELMESLRAAGVQLGIATYKRQDYAENILRHFGFDAYTPYLFGADFEGKLKKSDIIRNCLSAMGADDLSRVLMVGDTAHDAQGAKKLGVPFMAVTFGFGFKPGDTAEACDAAAVADAPADIGTFVFNETKGTCHFVSSMKVNETK